MYHADLREEIKFLKARLSYKAKKLDEAQVANNEEMVAQLRTQLSEIEQKLQICRAEADAQDDNKNEDWRQSNEQ